jgi:hypothetical protein
MCAVAASNVHFSADDISDVVSFVKDLWISCARNVEQMERVAFWAEDWLAALNNRLNSEQLQVIRGVVKDYEVHVELLARVEMPQTVLESFHAHSARFWTKNLYYPVLNKVKSRCSALSWNNAIGVSSVCAQPGDRSASWVTN